MKKTYKIEVDCANCANKMEEAAQRTPGVKSAVVNFMTLKMIVEFEDGQDPKAIMQQVRQNCKKVEDDCCLLYTSIILLRMASWHWHWHFPIAGKREPLP